MKRHKIMTAMGLTTAGLCLAVAASALAASGGVALTNNGFGELGSNPSSFGLAICSGPVAFSGSVPVSVTANGVTQSVTFTSPLAAGACGYLYVPYATFNMTPGDTYSISVTIDPQHSLITNANNQATYASVTVPKASSGGQVLGASVMSAAERQLLLGELATAENALKVLLLKISG